MNRRDVAMTLLMIASLLVMAVLSGPTWDAEPPVPTHGNHVLEEQP